MACDRNRRRTSRSAINCASDSVRSCTPSSYACCPIAAALLYEESAASIAERERLREQHRLAPATQYDERGRPTKKDRRAMSAFEERQRRRGN
jgi:hypothetical protein